MPCKKRTLFRDAVGAAKVTPDQTAHDIEQTGDVILGFTHTLGALDPYRIHLSTQVGQRPIVQKSGQVITCKGKDLAAPDANEQFHILVADDTVVDGAC